MIRLSAFADEISQDPQEQIDVLARHGIRHIEFRAIHGTNVLDLTDAQHDDFRRLLRARRIRALAPSVRRSARSGSPSRSSPTSSGSSRPWTWPSYYAIAANPRLQLLHPPRRRPGRPSRRGRSRG